MEYQNRQSAPGGAQAGNTAPHPPAGGPRAAAPQPRKVRRVGTVAFGITLIFVGILMVAAILVPGIDVLSVLRLSPLILVVLGVEVLIYSVRPDVTLKYDFLSMFVCFLLLAAAGCASILGQLAEGWGPSHEYAENRLAAWLEQQAYDALKDDGNIRDISVNVTLQRAVAGSERDTAGVTDADEVWAYVTLENRYTDAQSFAESCRAIIDEAEQAGLPFTSYTFDTVWDTASGSMANLSRSYYLNVDGVWSIHRTADQLVQDVDEDFWYDGDRFDSERDLNDYLAQFDTSVDQLLPSTAESAAQSGDLAAGEETA